MTAEYLTSHPVALLAAALAVMWIVRQVVGIAFKIVLVFAVIGAAAVAGGQAKLPAGISDLAAGLVSSSSDAASVGAKLFSKGGEE